MPISVLVVSHCAEMLIRSIALTFMVVIVSAAPVNADDESRRLTTRLSDVMAKLAEKADLVPRISVKDGVIAVAGRSVRILPISEQAITANGKFISAARFEVTLDGVKQNQLTVGSIGIGDSADDATNTAVEEWYLSFGSALFRSIAATDSDLTQGDFLVYAGPMGVRGQAPSDVIGGSTVTPQKILKAIAVSLPNADTRLHSVQVMVVISPDGAITGECKVDAQSSSTVLSSLKNISWPKTATGYMYKQSYVLRRR